MASFQTIENVVLEVLETYPNARKDDYVLMYFVCRKMCKNSISCPFGSVLLDHKELRIPNWKSVERARRKIQRKRPDLVDDKTAAVREEEEQAYIEYARKA